MKYLTTLLLLCGALVTQAQLPTRLKLKQLEVGPPNQTLQTDSLGNIVFGSGTADGNGIYSGSGEITDSTFAEFLNKSSILTLGYFINGFDYPSPEARGIVIDATTPVVRTSMYSTGESENNLASVVTAAHETEDVSPSVTISTLSDSGSAYSTSYFTSSGLDFDCNAVARLFINPSTGGSVEILFNEIPAYTFTATKIVAGSVEYHHGSGSPEGVVTAPIGSLYTNTAGGAQTLWVKQTGTGNTGWVAK